MNVTYLALAAALLTPLLTYLGIARRLSGKVKTSDAAQLWEESRSIRKDLLQRNEFLRGTIDRCEDRISRLEKLVEDLEKKNHELYLENGTLRRLIESHEETIHELHSTVKRLVDENEGLKTENQQLRKRVSELEATTNGTS